MCAHTFTATVSIAHHLHGVAGLTDAVKGARSVDTARERGTVLTVQLLTQTTLINV